MIPKGRIAVGIAGIASALLLPGSAPSAQLTDPVFLTYWEAKAAGVHVPPLPSETGIRVCTDADYHEGFRTPEAATEALAEYEVKWGEEGPGYCQEDPTEATYVVFPPGAGPRSIFGPSGDG